MTSSKPIGHLWAEPELKFMLLRFWTLKSSIENSNYTVTSMKIWNEPGRKELNHFFAMLGVSLEQANQKWTYVEPTIKRELKERILEKGAQKNMPDPI